MLMPVPSIPGRFCSNLLISKCHFKSLQKKSVAGNVGLKSTPLVLYDSIVFEKDGMSKTNVPSDSCDCPVFDLVSGSESVS